MLERITKITAALKSAGIEVDNSVESSETYDAEITLGGEHGHMSVSLGVDFDGGPYALLTVDAGKLLVSGHTDETIVAAILAA